MISRHLEAKLRSAARVYPVVHLTGPRQSGKTTLVRQVFRKHPYVSLEDPDEREFALADPRGFLGRFESGAVLDEVQRVPPLLSYLQTEADRDDRPGRFILTGSQQLLLRQQVVQTLAGRAALLHLLPFSFKELLRRKVPDPYMITRQASHPARPDRKLEEVLFTGMYPRIHDKGLDAHDWLANYYRTYVEKDVRQVLRVGDLETYQRFVRLCAGRNGQLLNFSSLAADCGISHATARQWVSTLQASFLVTLIRPHHRNFSKRLIKSPKLYFLDTGLLCYLLRINDAESLLTHPQRGAIFEAFVISETIKAFMNVGSDPPLFFWRDRTGHEVDLVIEKGDELLPIEIKSGRTVVADSFKSLKFWLALEGNSQENGTLVYGGDKAFRRQTINVRPWFA